MNADTDPNDAALVAKAELAEIQAKNQAWDKLTPLQKLELRAEHAEAFLLAFKPTDGGALEKQNVRVAMEDIDALRKFNNGYGQQFLRANANKRERKTSTKQRKQEREETNALYRPAISGRSETRHGQPVEVYLSLVAAGAPRYKNLKRWASTFDRAYGSFDIPPEFKGAVVIGNLVIPVFSQLGVASKGKAAMELFAVDEPSDVRLIASGRLIGNNDILRFTFVHRDAVVDCMSTRFDPDRRDIPGPLPFSDETRQALAGQIDAEGQENHA